MREKTVKGSSRKFQLWGMGGGSGWVRQHQNKAILTFPA